MIFVVVLFHRVSFPGFAVLLLAKLVAVAAATAKMRRVYDEKPPISKPYFFRLDFPPWITHKQTSCIDNHLQIEMQTRFLKFTKHWTPQCHRRSRYCHHWRCLNHHGHCRQPPKLMHAQVIKKCNDKKWCARAHTLPQCIVQKRCHHYHFYRSTCTSTLKVLWTATREKNCSYYNKYNTKHTYYKWTMLTTHTHTHTTHKRTKRKWNAQNVPYFSCTVAGWLACVFKRCFCRHTIKIITIILATDFSLWFFDNFSSCFFLKLFFFGGTRVRAFRCIYFMILHIAFGLRHCFQRTCGLDFGHCFSFTCWPIWIFLVYIKFCGVPCTFTSVKP